MAFLVPKLLVLVLHEILHFGKFEGADFKYDNRFFKFTIPKYLNNVFSVPNVKSSFVF